MNRRVAIWGFVLTAAFVVAGCGDGGNPSSPSKGHGVLVQGVVLGSEAAAVPSGLQASSSSKRDKITVKVDGTAITATVSASGTFVLEDVPAGPITLVFYRNGVEIGRITATVAEGGTLKVVVKVDGDKVELVDMEVKNDDEDDDASKTCGIEGGKLGRKIQLEGSVDSVAGADFKMKVNGERSTVIVDVDAAAATFKCNGKDGKAATECKSLLVAGAKVHVGGMLSECSMSAAKVTATDVKVQKAGAESEE